MYTLIFFIFFALVGTSRSDPIEWPCWEEGHGWTRKRRWGTRRWIRRKKINGEEIGEAKGGQNVSCIDSQLGRDPVSWWKHH